MILTTAGIALAGAETPSPVESVSFKEAIQRAVDRHPSVAAATAGILRAEALLEQARSALLLQVNGTVTTTTLNRGVEFDGTTVTPRNQVAGTLNVQMPIVAPVAAARRAQAAQARNVASLNAADVRRQVAVATAEAYLAIIAARRTVEATERARDVARAHFDLARQLEQAGRGSRLNALRAQQDVSTDEGLVEARRLALYRAQEALGAITVAQGPVDATDEPMLEPAPGVAQNVEEELLHWRTDLQLFAERERINARVVDDSSKEHLPSLQAMFQPQMVYPAQFFLPANSWRFFVQMNVPILDGGQRAGLRRERQAALEESRAFFARAMTEAKAELRTAREATASAERGLASARAAADQARQVVEITHVSYRAGAATNIEVIDAQRRALDADTAAAMAEDTLRRARLELLMAMGRFP